MLRELPKWLEGMTVEDIGFIHRFLLSSGSLKQMAAEYDISYPTIRLRLDRLIEKIKLYDAYDQSDPFELLLRSKVVEGKMDTATLSTLLAAYRDKGKSGKKEGES